MKEFIGNRGESFEIVTAENILELGIDPQQIRDELSAFYNKQSLDGKHEGTFEGMQVFNSFDHNWRAIINGEKEIIGYWFFVAIRDNIWSEILKGGVDEDKITEEMIEFIEFPGIYNGYMLCSSIKNQFRTPHVAQTLFSSFAQYLNELAEAGIVFSEIAGTAETAAGVSTVRGLGMKPLCDYCGGGKLFYLDMVEIDSVPLYRNTPGLVERYKTLLRPKEVDLVSVPQQQPDTIIPPIFISYSSKEADVAKEVCAYLEKNGLNCWIAPRNVDPGGNYATQIVRAIRSCSILVLLASDNTNASGHVSNEVSLAFDNKKVIIPFKIRDITFSDEYLYFLGRKHWIEAHRDMSAGLNQLTRTIHEILKVNSDISENNSEISIKKNELMRGETVNSAEEILSMSTRYFKKNFLHLIDCADEEFVNICNKYSKMFFPITSFEHFGKKEKLDGFLIDELARIINKSDEVNILKITGNSGCDKNALMQLLYLRIYKDSLIGNNSFIPAYIGLPFYEKKSYNKETSIAKQIREELEHDLKPFVEYAKTHPERKPLIFIDGIRDCIFNKTLIEHILAEKLSDIRDLKRVVSVDTNFTVNKRRQKKVIALAPSNFEFIANINTVDLVDDDICEAFFKAFEGVYDIEVANLPEKLRQLSFYEIDAYILRNMASIVQDNLENQSFSISDLYEALCMEMFNGSREMLLRASKVAFDFSYNEMEFEDNDVFSSRLWRLIKRHKSYLDFLVSYYYINQLTECGENWDVAFFELVLPKEVTRFITPRLNDSYSNEEKVIQLCKRHFHDMGTLGKSEMTFWLGRIKNPKLAVEAKQMLQEYYDEMIRTTSVNEYEDINVLKDRLFLLRGISVSLIYSGVDRIAEEYICRMIDDDIVNAINRGFHLEYYGDKSYMPNKNMLDFEDDITTGEKTLKRLVKNLEAHFAKRTPSAILALDLFTMCSLVQARIETSHNDIDYQLKKYMETCVKFLETYLTRSIGLGNEKIDAYFHMVFKDFKAYGNYGSPNAIACNIYNNYSKASDVKRTGWVDLGIPDPESIVEHMYNTWLLGMLNLPATHDDENYSKARILSMLMIHDLGETETGDVPKPLKVGKPEYDENENKVMSALFLKGTYPGMPNLNEFYELWSEWRDQKTINARIAKDLDILQALYQFCTYYTKFPDKFTDEKRLSWLSEYRDLNTEIGIQLYERIIRSNSEFTHLFIRDI